MQWLDNARGRALKSLQAKNATLRKAVRAEAAAELGAMPVYRAMRWFKRGEMTTPEGEEIKAEAVFLE